ncbi:SAM-dependent methyltransferase [Algihabitans albus]|uniref:SAM-dependent methyltransferase n=1 Tax=Algihabitans albus TaxID=2164067 RepID=UPI000E5CBA3E|nr:SAM-dependent methyltransferase [Algihabitans albus]
MKGTLYGLGVGPGDPELMTLKAHRLLQQVPVIAYSAPEQGESPARAIAAPYIPADCTEILVRTTKDGTSPTSESASDDVVKEIAEILLKGHDIVLLCEGDPLFYNDSQPLLVGLAEHFSIQIVPGVSSLSACAAALGSPLAARDEQLLVIPAGLAARTLTIKLSETDAAAVIDLNGHFAKVRDCLAVTGLLPRSRYIEHATHDRQRVLSLDQVDSEQVPRCSMVLMRR